MTIQRITGMFRGGSRTFEIRLPTAIELPEVPLGYLNRGGFGLTGGLPALFRLFDGQYGSQIGWLLAFR